LRFQVKRSVFTAIIGVDDEVGDKGSVTFEVVGDGKPLFESGPMRGGGDQRLVVVDLRGVKNLVLKIGNAGDNIDYDHADWAEANIEMSEGRPEMMGPPKNPPSS